MKIVGMGVSNKPGDDGFSHLVESGYRAVIILEGQANMIPALRQAVPGIHISLRPEVGGAAWDPPAHGYSPESWAEKCIEIADRFQPDILVPWNESNLEWPSMFPNIFNVTRAQYANLANWADRFLVRWRELTVRPVAWPALAPGHQTDDGVLGSEVLAPIAIKFDRVDFHFYLVDDSEWWADRFTREFPFYRGAKAFAITEFNRPYNRNSAEDVSAYSQQIQRWVARVPNVFDGTPIESVLYFIENGNGFDDLISRDCQPLEATLKELAAAPKGGEGMKLVPRSNWPGYAIGPNRLDFLIVDDAGKLADPPRQGAATLIEAWPLSDDGLTTYITDAVSWDYDVLGDDVDDKLQFYWERQASDFNIPVNHPVMVHIRVQFIDLTAEHWNGAYGWEGDVIVIPGANPFPPPKPEGTTIPVPSDKPRPLSPYYDAIWKVLGDLDNLSKEIPDAALSALAIQGQEHIVDLKKAAGLQ